MSDIHGRTVMTDGYPTHLLEAGDRDADDVLLLHGCGLGSTASADWQAFIPELASQYHVIVPDLVGSGRTQYPAGRGEGMRAWLRGRVRQVLSLMRELSIDQAHVVGYAFAGTIALHLLVSAADRFVRASLVSSTGGTGELTPELRTLLGFYGEPSIAALADLTSWGIQDEQSLDQAFTDIVRDRYTEVMRPEVRAVFEGCFAAPSAHEDLVVPPAALRRIVQEVLLVHGREDRFVLPAAAVHLQQHLPNAQLHIYPHTGHWVVAERRREYARLLLDFLDGPS